MASTRTQTRHLTPAELLAEARERFGDSPDAWAFQCPNCGDVATGLDFRNALAANPRKNASGTLVYASSLLGQECIGRVLGALKVRRASDWKGRGCDWVAYGLISGPWTIEMPWGRKMSAFPLAETADVARKTAGAA